MVDELTRGDVAVATQAFLANGGTITVLPTKTKRQSNQKTFPTRRPVRVRSMHRLNPEELSSRIL